MANYVKTEYFMKGSSTAGVIRQLGNHCVFDVWGYGDSNAANLLYFLEENPTIKIISITRDNGKYSVIYTE